MAVPRTVLTLNLELCVRDGQAPVQASYAVW